MGNEVESPPKAPIDLFHRYRKADLACLSEPERLRFLAAGDADPQSNPTLAWELLYRLEPDLYDRLIRAERIHPAVLDWLPHHVRRTVEVGAGTGRLTMALVDHCAELIAIEPAAPLRARLATRLAGRSTAVRLLNGFFDALPVDDGAADLVIACSALTPEPAHGGDAGLREMERVCAVGGRVVIVWPNQPDWLLERGYQYLSFPGPMHLEFESLDEALELARIFYPKAVDAIRRRGDRRLPYELVGVNPPRDLAWKEKLP